MRKTGMVLLTVLLAMTVTPLQLSAAPLSETGTYQESRTDSPRNSTA